MRGIWSKFRYFTRILWVRAIAIGCLAIVSIALASTIGPYIPEGLSDTVDRQGVDRVLDSLANAMLTVTTFSVSVMVAVRNAATSRWTPRYIKLLARDPVTQNVLASFIGAYIFALVSIILSNASAFTRGGIFVLFGMTCIAILLVVVAIVRWVAHLQEVGSLSETAQNLQNFIMDCLNGKKSAPCWGANSQSTAKKSDTISYSYFTADVSGYLTHIDLMRLQKMAVKDDIEVHFTVRVGDYIRRGEEIGYTTDGANLEHLMKYVYFSGSRSFIQDVRFGIIALVDIAIKALSPGVNDPETAVEVVRRLDALIEYMDLDENVDKNTVEFGKIWLLPNDTKSLIDESFRSIYYYGKDHPSVLSTMKLTLSHYVENGSPEISDACSIWLSKID